MVISEWLNQITVYNKAALYEAVEKRRKYQALVTVSNHRSCFDDPVLWGNMLLHVISIHFSVNIFQNFVFSDSLSLLLLYRYW